MKHKGDVPIHRFQAATWEPKLLVDVDVEPKLIFKGGTYSAAKISTKQC